MNKYLKRGIIVFELLLIVSLLRGIEMSKKSRGRVSELEKRREEASSRKEELEKRLEYVESEEYLEKVAREELNLAKEGETVVILPDQKQLQEQEEGEVVEEMTNWEKWKVVLFGKIR